ncbi:MAG: gas vesicle protein [Solirubrobacterales bacterium]|nr:gas vesicle protein [Solirubrobacterales bacterium]
MAQKQQQRRGTKSNDDNGGANPAELARTARQQLAELTGRVPEGVLGLSRDEDNWKLTVEVVELSRVPSSTDVLGCYVVTLDQDGELVGYERVGRYLRAQSGGGEQ